MSMLTLRGNPLRNFFSTGPWAAMVYLASYLPVGTLLFGGVGVVVVVSYVLNITWLGLPLLIGAAGVVRGAAQLERRRAALVGEPIEPEFRPLAGPGVFARVRAAWRDLATWRACAYLLLLYPLLFLLDLTVLVLWLGVLAGVALPAWFWSVSIDLRGGGRAKGIWLGYPVDTLPVALLTAVGFAVLALIVAYLLVGAAKLHAIVARTLLGPRIDPLAEAKQVLAEPGPLTV